MISGKRRRTALHEAGHAVVARAVEIRLGERARKLLERGQEKG